MHHHVIPCLNSWERVNRYVLGVIESCVQKVALVALLRQSHSCINTVNTHFDGSLSSNKAGDEGAVALAEVIPSLTALRYLK